MKSLRLIPPYLGTSYLGLSFPVMAQANATSAQVLAMDLMDPGSCHAGTLDVTKVVERHVDRGE
jgi:hypothetical protein